MHLQDYSSPKFKIGDWVLFRESNEFCIVKISNILSDDYKVSWLYDSVKDNTISYGRMMNIENVDSEGHKMTDMEIKFFKVLYE